MSDGFRIVLSFIVPYLMTPLAGYALYSLVNETKNSWKQENKRKKIIIMCKIYFAAISMIFGFSLLMKSWS